MNDGLDSLLEHIPDWTASQADELMDTDDESDLLVAARRADQQRGNPLFAVNMERVRAPRSFHRGVAIQMQVRFSLEQLRPPNGEYQGWMFIYPENLPIVRAVHLQRSEVRTGTKDCHINDEW